MPPSLSVKIERHVKQLFPAGVRTEAASLLVDECGDNLPLMDDPELVDRIRIAALKVSEGDLARLRDAIDLAKVDWRDLLVIAGFGTDVLAHRRWEPPANG